MTIKLRHADGTICADIVIGLSDYMVFRDAALGKTGTDEVKKKITDFIEGAGEYLIAGSDLEELAISMGWNDFDDCGAKDILVTV